ncbi:MAG TPA: hypothetical protein VGP13_00570 [Candidatus Paceibacterota bacterium]|jgi:hypothetical protein|nr:hypothetical protein [Candidatus Paceibacterota bacterium]
MMALLKKNMVVIGVIVVALAALYYFYSSGDSGALLSTDQNTSPVSQEILTTLGSLRVIKLDSSVFEDPLFLSLSDFGVSIPPAAAGRRNPFAPVGTGGASTGAAASTTVSKTASSTASTTSAH